MPSSHHISGLSRSLRYAQRRERTARRLVSTLVAVGALLVVPASVLAAPPSLQAPAAAASVTQGKTVTYEWSGDLQGAEAARDQSYFKIEVIEASKAPAGQQSAWDADTVKLTTPGEATTSVDMGAPPSGSWKWRVCAWGVVDPNVSVTVEQIPNGCSAARALTSAAAIATQDQDVQVIEDTRHVTVTTAPKIIERVRPASPVAATPVEETPEPVTSNEEPVADVIQPVKIEAHAPESQSTSGGGKHTSSLGLSSDDGIGAADPSEQAAAHNGNSAAGDISSALANGLSATIPGIPIPFWVLLFMIVSVPIAMVWRRSVLAMFEWSDGSIDGFGTPDAHAVPVLAHVQSAQGAHAFGGAADDAAMPSATITEVSTSHRAA
jgi:hypothetical protein